MSNSVEGSVNAALMLQNQATLQQKNNLLLRKAFDNQANMISTLMETATSSGPKLASGGSVGTLLHTTA